MARHRLQCDARTGDKTRMGAEQGRRGRRGSQGTTTPIRGDEMSATWAVQACMLLVVLPVVAAFVSIVYFTLTTGISPMPSSGHARRAMLEVVPPGQDGTIVDLGSGWGSLVVPLARQHPGARVCGYELSWVPFLCSWVRCRISRPPNLHLRRDDFFPVSLSDVDVVVCYLYTSAMQRLKGKFQAELRPGALVVSHTFAIHGWQAERVIQLDDIYATRIYLYRLGPLGPAPHSPSSKMAGSML